MRLIRVRGGGLPGLLVLLLVAAVWAVVGLYPFLARQAPVQSEVLVIEGWMADDVLREAAGWAESNGVKKIYTTGGPIEMGGHLTEWQNFAAMTKARLEQLGLGRKFEIVAVPAPKVRRGRTMESARTLQAAMLLKRGAFNLASEGPHTRRSWRTFQRVFGDEVEVGSVALTPTEYGADDWWTCSEGARSVLSETVAYVYDLLPGGVD